VEDKLSPEDIAMPTLTVPFIKVFEQDAKSKLCALCVLCESLTGAE
jgi:hypothetical protein